MGNVMVIPARRQVGNNIKKAEKPKLRVAAYCRVSTDSDEQATSYEAQIEHYTEFIQKNPEWVLAGIFADDGISGTNTKKRDEFNRMIEDLTKCGLISVRVEDSITYYDSTPESDLYEGKKLSIIRKFVLDALEAIAKGVTEGGLNTVRDPQYTVLI